MNKLVFEFSDYQSYLLESLGGANKRTGQRSRLAQAVGCQPAYVSRVLGGQAHFSLEQGVLISAFLQHDEEETEYFLLLIQLSRAGSERLKAHFQKAMGKILTSRRKISERVKGVERLSEEARDTYYSSWHYSAIHIALTIKKLCSISSLCEHFRLERAQVSGVVDFLVLHGLAKRDGADLTIGPSHIHLEDDAKQINQHHTNWRLEAVRSLSNKRPSDLHYSVVYSMSQEALQSVREETLKLIKKNLDVVKPSKEETLIIFNLDMFEI